MNTPCREWAGPRFHHGYGKRSLKRFRSRMVHRQIIEMVGEDKYGTPWDPTLKALHECDNPPCFRYDHLFLGTQADNVRDAQEKGRHGKTGQHKTHCPKGHLYDEANTSWARGYQDCLTCRREDNQRRRGR